MVDSFCKEDGFIDETINKVHTYLQGKTPFIHSIKRIRVKLLDWRFFLDFLIPVIILNHVYIQRTSAKHTFKTISLFEVN